MTDGNILVVISNPKLCKVNRKQQCAIVVSQWAVAIHAQQDVVDRALSGSKCHFVSFGLSA